MLFFFFSDPATTEIYTLSLPDALPILIQDESLRGTSSWSNMFLGRDHHRYESSEEPDGGS